MDIALTPNGKTAYVSCGNSNTVAVINTAAKTEGHSRRLPSRIPSDWR